MADKMYIFLQSDSFAAKSRSNADKARMSSTMDGPEYGNPTAPVRRPYRGIQIKKDTYAALSVVKADGTALSLTTSSSRASRASSTVGKALTYSDFILQRVDDQRVEKNQIIETFGDSFVYFFGERPRVVNISGLLMNTEDFNWRAQFWANYERHFRGTRLVENNARIYLAYDTIVLEGYPISASAADDASDPYSIPFQMTILMTNYHDYSSVGETLFPGILPKDNIAALNVTLAKFTDMGPDVRAANLQNSGSSGFKSFLNSFREGIRGLNKVAGAVTQYLDKAKSMLAGRAVTLPEGVAGYIEQVGQANVGFAGRSRFAALGASGKVTMSKPTQFGPTWESGVTGTQKGLIWESYDEYPLLLQPANLGMISASKNTKIAMKESLTRQEKLVMAVEEEKAILAKINTLSDQGGVVGTITDAVAFARNNFAMVMTAGRAVTDPLGTVSSALGIQPSDIPQLGIAVLREPLGPLNAFIGSDGTFKTLAAYANFRRFDASVAALMGTEQNLSYAQDPQDGAAGLGDLFKGDGYQNDDSLREQNAPTESNDPGNYAAAAAIPRDYTYEKVYSKKEYTELLRQSSTAASLQKALDEAYGDVDTSSLLTADQLTASLVSYEAAVTPASIEGVYSSGGIQNTQVPTDEQALVLDRAYSQIDQSLVDAEPSGIRTSRDDDGEIAPYV